MQLGGIHLTDVGATKSPASPPVDTSSDGSKAMGEKFHATLSSELSPQSAPQVRQTVPASRTQLSTTEAADALRQAWTQHFGEEPREDTVAVLTAQWSHETGGGRSMYNYNFGGIKGTGPSGLTVSQRTKEGWGQSERTIRDNFRAYKSATEGAHDYVSLLRRKYAGAVDAAHQGDPKSFVQELKKGGYFTGNEGAYIRSVSHRTAQILGRQPSAVSTPAPEGLSPLTNRVPSQPGTHLAAATKASMGEGQAIATGNDLGHAAAQSLEAADHSWNGQAAWRGAPSTNHLEAFDDALSRAALRIALDTPGLLHDDRRRDS